SLDRRQGPTVQPEGVWLEPDVEPGRVRARTYCGLEFLPFRPWMSSSDLFLRAELFADRRGFRLGVVDRLRTSLALDSHLPAPVVASDYVHAPRFGIASAPQKAPTMARTSATRRRRKSQLLTAAPPAM